MCTLRNEELSRLKRKLAAMPSAVGAAAGAKCSYCVNSQRRSKSSVSGRGGGGEGEGANVLRKRALAAEVGNFFIDQFFFFQNC